MVTWLFKNYLKLKAKFMVWNVKRKYRNGLINSVDKSLNGFYGKN